MSGGRISFLTALAAALIGAGCWSLEVRREQIPLFVTQNARDLAMLVNRYRERNGLPGLRWSTELYLVARRHNQDMAERNYFSHYTPEFLTPFDRLANARIEYLYAGENIAHGQTTPEKVLSDWLNSPAHRRNIESVLYTHHAVVYDPANHYWTHLFINFDTEPASDITAGYRAFRYGRHRYVPLEFSQEY